MADTFARSHGRPEAYRVSASGDDAEPVMLTDQDHDTKTTEANQTASSGEGTPNRQRADTVGGTHDMGMRGSAVAGRAAHRQKGPDTRSGRYPSNFRYCSRDMPGSFNPRSTNAKSRFAPRAASLSGIEIHRCGVVSGTASNGLFQATALRWQGFTPTTTYALLSTTRWTYTDGCGPVSSLAANHRHANTAWI